jgi:pilus assembly protein HofN
MEQINLCPWHAALRINRLRKCAQYAIATAILLALVACYVSYSTYLHMHHWRMDTAIYQQQTQRLQQQKTQLLMWNSQAKTQFSQYQRYEKGRESGLQLSSLLLDIQRYVPAQIWFTRLSLQSGQLELEGTALTPEAIAVFIGRFSGADSIADLHLLKMADTGQGQQSFLLQGKNVGWQSGKTQGRSHEDQ